MTWPDFWTSTTWLAPALLLLAIAGLAAAWASFSAPASWNLRLATWGLKLLGVGLLVCCLLEPAYREQVPVKEANVFVALIDRSQSLDVRDTLQRNETRTEAVQKIVNDRVDWQAALDDAFDFRRYYFGNALRSVNAFEANEDFDTASDLGAALTSLQQRLQGKSVGGLLLFTDGNLTDPDQLPPSFDFPIYPVRIAGPIGRDLTIRNLTVSETNFEAAPVTIVAELEAQGLAGETVVVELLNLAGDILKTESVAGVQDNKRFAVRFEDRPLGTGPHFYSVRARRKAAENQPSLADDGEATLINNQRMFAVDRSQGPYRILYVSGRPNWELKFLHRAVEEDDELDLVKLIRVANREPKFSFRGRIGESTNPLFRGFNNLDEDDAASYDEAVVISLPADHELAAELDRKFPTTAEQLYQFSAVILDDIEADCFTPDQHSLVQQFVSERGGTLLMLGGLGTFDNGRYGRTPIGQMLPIYLDRNEPVNSRMQYTMELTRDGWLQPWTRLRATEAQEQTRLAGMPPFEVVSPASLVKPGATVLASLRGDDQSLAPGLVVQKFGKGHSAALMIGDLWRWQMRKPESGDLPKFWRQLHRWMVADVPQRFEVQIKQDDLTTLRSRVVLRNEKFAPLDNARVMARIIPIQTGNTTTSPDATNVDTARSTSFLDLTALPHDQEPGVYELEYTPKQSGPFRIEWTATGPDGADLGTRTTGWVAQPLVQELTQLNANQEFLERLAQASGGRIVEPRELDSFCRAVPVTEAMVTETKVHPWWHAPFLFWTAIGCLIAEWGLRRWKGLP
ncbi:MAG: hypothetical protein KF851_02020 [Pirellulaceae bacterium]|nr:hypothetical protein [Pirellulaceae bacterium]